MSSVMHDNINKSAENVFTKSSVLPKDASAPRVHGNGYVVRDTSPEKPYDIILLSD